MIVDCENFDAFYGLTLRYYYLCLLFIYN